MLHSEEGRISARPTAPTPAAAEYDGDGTPMCLVGRGQVHLPCGVKQGDPALGSCLSLLGHCNEDIERQPQFVVLAVLAVRSHVVGCRSGHRGNCRVQSCTCALP